MLPRRTLESTFSNCWGQCELSQLKLIQLVGQNCHRHSLTHSARPITHTHTHTHTLLVTMSWVSAAWSCNPTTERVKQPQLELQISFIDTVQFVKSWPPCMVVRVRWARVCCDLVLFVYGSSALSYTLIDWTIWLTKLQESSFWH